MKIFTAEKIRKGDQYTIEKEPVKSIDLMEKAAENCGEWIQENFDLKTTFYVFCGVGNNGGDGYALARILSRKGYKVYTYTVLFTEKISEDCRTNKKRFEAKYPSNAKTIKHVEDFPLIHPHAVIIDALFGTGLNRPLEGLVKAVVQKINQQDSTIISIDIPSGLQAENNPIEKTAITAQHTLSFEFYKLSFFFTENQKHTGNIHILSIGIHPDYIQKTATPYQLITPNFVAKNSINRSPHTHKGTYGHGLLMVGSYGKTGAAVLATQAMIHSGLGLASVYVPKSSYAILQTTVPEAMCICDDGEYHLTYFSEKEERWNAAGVGPGIGTDSDTVHFLKHLLKKWTKPMVLDADALNILSKDAHLFSYLPKDTILTPHPKEFERLFGKTSNSYERLRLQIKKSKELKIVIVLKGHHTTISSPDGAVWFNNTGNAGMATGGSGDVLTGILTGLLAQGYEPYIAAIIGVWLHGKAGDLALATESMESLTASSLISYLGPAFKSVHHNR